MPTREAGEATRRAGRGRARGAAAPPPPVRPARPGPGGVPAAPAVPAPAAGGWTAPRRLPSPVLAAYRRWDAAAVLAVLAAGWLAAHLPAGARAPAWARLQVSLADVALLLGFVWLWPVLADAAGLYHPALVPGSLREARRVAAAATLASAVPLAAGLLPLGDSFEAPSAALFWAGATLALLAERALVRGVSRRVARPRKVVIAGSGRRARELVDEVRARPDLAIHLAGYLDDRDDPAFEAATGLCRLGGVDGAERALMRVDADEVLITLPVRSRYAQVQRVIAACERTGTDSRYFADLFQFSTGRPGFERGAVVLRSFPEDGRRHVKRALDVGVSLVALVLAAPLMALVAAAIRLDSPGPALFAQERHGLHRHTFRLWKFRTMEVGAEARQAALEARNEAGGALFKIRDDPRITRVGRWLRRASLDELPQLWNVLRGEMSLVGPRPLPLRDVARFDEPWLLRRFSAPPGLTGPWQVHGRSNAGFDDLVAMDLEYVDRWSLGLDLRILAATVPAVLRGHGAM
ncbi:MAG TPA: sugar transferase [Longimicrobium sp.]|nr:sugar transferase [Longimicrobium sp.]